MQFPESWLREFCDPPLTTAELAHLLTMAGMEVEDTRTVAPPFSGVVVGRILDAVPHPQADRLRVCTVDAGSHSLSGPLQIVCGAPNARTGLRVPLALVGAVLPPAADGHRLTIGVGQLRGVESRGMLCSAKELQIADDAGGLLELGDDAPVGTDLRAWLRLDDTVFTLKLTPNLGHCLSVHGIAREVAALTGAPLRRPAIAPVVPRHDRRLPVDVQAPDLCGRFSGRIVSGVNTLAKTPSWMVERLARCGQRSVSALVDISNYVMFELGRPSHIFDLDRIGGGLVVRWGRPGERLELLNGSTVDVDAEVGVIADEGGLESLAGIMGGAATAVSDSTTNIYIEAAFWWPESVAGRSRRFNFSTDAGHRFERGVDPATTVLHIERITQLVLDICGGEAGAVDDLTLRLPQPAPVKLRIDRAARVVGMPISRQQCVDAMRRLELPFTESDGAIVVTPPSWRFDLRIEEDLIEEVIRLVGFDRLPSTPPLAPVMARVGREGRRTAHAAREALAALGYQETISFSFVEAQWEHELAGNLSPIRVLNPIATPLAVMRSSLIGSLVQVLRHNLARKAGQLRIFEIGRVFMRDAAVADGPLEVAGVHQPMRIGGLAYGPAAALQWGMREQAVDFYDVKGDIESLLAPQRATFTRAVHPALHPGRSAAVSVGGRVIGHLGELHPRWRLKYELPQAPVLFELDLDAVLQRPVPQAMAVPRQQPVWRDQALVVRDDLTHDALITALQDDPARIVRGATLFDVYKPSAPVAGIEADEHSCAVRLELRDDEVTLTDERIDAAVGAALARARTAVGARPRT